MIIYSSDKIGFLHDVGNGISHILQENILKKLGEKSSEGEIRSWNNSLQYMRDVLDSTEIPDNVGVALEYNIPVTNNRIDFIITGTDKNANYQAILIELKQWSHINPTNKDGIVAVHFADGKKEIPHPSYQVSSYASLLTDFKEAVQTNKVSLHPCAYLHNYIDDGIIRAGRYNQYVEESPVFCRGEEQQLRDFIKKFISKGDRSKSIYEIEDSKIIPSKSLIDSVVSMSEGNPIFKMIDEQKVVYENILSAYDLYQESGQKQVIIVSGGPGTGKSVIAIKLLFEMTRRKLLAHYVTKNAAPRYVFCDKFRSIQGVHSTFQYLFKGSGIYYDQAYNTFDMLLVDEAHRLQLLSGRYGNLGENQVKEIINASKVSVFFLDEHQRVTLKDIGSHNEITTWANMFNAQIHDFKLQSQFRCSGSDEFINWLDHLLQYDNKEPIKFSGTTYDFRLFDNPQEMMMEIRKCNRKGRSRMVAGYCWDWVSQTNAKVKDICFPEYNFAYKWNLKNDMIWSVSEGSINQIGCIHTCQGLEFDYVGVIIGMDLICRDGKILVDPGKRSRQDYSIYGWKKKMKEDPEGTKVILREIIKNTYRTLMTRGMKGCFVYACDPELREYIRTFLD